MKDNSIEQLIYQSIQKLNWWIDGIGRHGISVELINNLSPDDICRIYNVEKSFFIL